MTTNDYGLWEAKNAWFVFKEARDRFEESTKELRIRYARFAYKHGTSKNSNEFKVTEEMHLQALNPADFEGNLLFMDRDSIFGVQYHQVPVEYLADPDKWEAEFHLRKEEEERVKLRRMIRMENDRLQGSIERMKKTVKPEETLLGQSIQDDLSVLHKLKDYLVREVTEANGKSEISKAVDMVVLATLASKDDVQTALVYAESQKELIVHGTKVYTPEGYELWIGDNDEYDSDGIDSYETVSEED